jgi:hypothetical protein
MRKLGFSENAALRKGPAEKKCFFKRNRFFFSKKGRESVNLDLKGRSAAALQKPPMTLGKRSERLVTVRAFLFRARLGVRKL